ncbi:MAG: capsular polysaccharide synthesis protein [Bacillota bacterium]
MKKYLRRFKFYRYLGQVKANVLKEYKSKDKLKYIREFGFVFYFKLRMIPIFKSTNTVAKRKAVIDYGHKLIANKLDKEFGEFLQFEANKYRTKYSDIQSKPTPKIIWNFWYQGNQDDIEIIKVCMDSVRRNVSEDVELITITKDNLAQYLDIPVYIYAKLESGLITITHFSDIVRMGLLSQYGGCWLDATCYVTGDISYVFDKAFWSIKRESNAISRDVPKRKWTSFAQCACANCMINHLIYLLFIKYWVNHNTLLHYILIDYFMDMVYRHVQEAKELIDAIEYNNPDVWSLVQAFDMRYDEVYFSTITASTNVFKTTCKGEFKKVDGDGNITFHGYITEGK